MGPLGCASFLECFHKPPSQFPIFPERRKRTPFPLLVRRRGTVMGPADFEVQVTSDRDCTTLYVLTYVYTSDTIIIIKRKNISIILKFSMCLFVTLPPAPPHPTSPQLTTYLFGTNSRLETTYNTSSKSIRQIFVFCRLVHQCVFKILISEMGWGVRERNEVPVWGYLLGVLPQP